MVPGLRKQVAIAFLQVLGVAFNVPANSNTGTWTDDGGYARTVNLRGMWSPATETLPEFAVQARLPRFRPPAGHLLKMSTLAKGQTHAPVYGAVMDQVRVRCLVVAQTEDEREQLSDAITDVLWSGVNASNVPYATMLQNRGVTILESLDDVYRELRAQEDPAHGPVIYYNDMGFLARVQFVYQPTVTAVSAVTVVPTLLGVSFDLTTLAPST